MQAVKWAFVIVIGTLGPSVGHTEEQSTCSVEAAEDPARVVYHCPNGLFIEAETLEELSGIVPHELLEIQSIDVEGRAVLIEVPPEDGLFQVRTPFAIASVRGTTYVVDAHLNQTDVFVIEGRVHVANPDGSQEVEVLDGQGVTFGTSVAPEVRSWPDDRVEALLERFGR